jgi:hypothetical protein
VLHAFLFIEGDLLLAGDEELGCLLWISRDIADSLLQRSELLVLLPPHSIHCCADVVQEGSKEAKGLSGGVQQRGQLAGRCQFEHNYNCGVP